MPCIGWSISTMKRSMAFLRMKKNSRLVVQRLSNRMYNLVAHFISKDRDFYRDSRYPRVIIFRHHELVAIERFHEPACTYLRFIYYYYYCYRWYCVITYKCSRSSRRSSHRNSRSVNSNERTRATNESVGQGCPLFFFTLALVEEI